MVIDIHSVTLPIADANVFSQYGWSPIVDLITVQFWM